MKNVSKAKLKSMPLPSVPAAQQRTFADRLDCVNAQRLAMQQVGAAHDELFGSLQSRAFRVEL